MTICILGLAYCTDAATINKSTVYTKKMTLKQVSQHPKQVRHRYSVRRVLENILWSVYPIFINIATKTVDLEGLLPMGQIV